LTINVPKKFLRFDNVIELALTKFLHDQRTLYKFSCVERPELKKIIYNFVYFSVFLNKGKIGIKIL
jgi:hypothetical protein